VIWSKVLWIYIISTLFISCSDPNPGILHLELSENWKFRLITDTIVSGLGDEFHEAKVPGCIHTDLLQNQIIEDPFYRDNEEMLQWIENMDWEYVTTFGVDNQILQRDNIQLEFKGIDTYADVFLNDSLILTVDNMFRTWNIDCKHYLRNGENEMRIHFKSPIEIEKTKRDSMGFDLPDIRGFTRKAPYHYGWDWGPRFVTAGIWRPVILSSWDNVKINDIRVIQKEVEKDSAKVSVELEIQSDDTLVSTVQVSLQAGANMLDMVDQSFTLVPGKNKVNLDLIVTDPQLWWPNGMGEAFLYDLKCELSVDDAVVDQKDLRTGLRKIELVQEQDSIGKSFYFKVNGVPVFIKGANYIPQDNFLAEVTDNQYIRTIKSAVEANMNMLRVWGGGIYENDIFYELCDENGIMVWQDFMFACNMYPGDYDFLENVRREAIDNVKRLRNHPCIALWCGNNEVDEGWKNWGWQRSLSYTEEKSDQIWNDYQAVFHRLLPSVLKQYNPEVAYWPSSPKYGWGHEESMQEGDSHYWGVWWGAEPFEVYEEKVGRFMSEYGFQGYPEFSTISKFTVDSDRTVDSDVMKAHQKHPRGIELVETYMERDYLKPKDFNSFLYVSQLLQAEGIKTAIEAHRRAKPHCMGTLYWQLNDCWPVASWSGVDYYGRWKALHYYVRDAYKTFMISADDNEDMLNVYVVSDSVDAIDAILDLRLMTFDGEVLFEEKLQISVPGLSSDVFYSTFISDLMSNVGGIEQVEKDAVFLYGGLLHGDVLMTRNIHYFVKPKNLTLPTFDISSKINKVNDHWEIELSTNHLAKNVYLRSEGDDGFFSDNYFDMIPDETRLIKYYSDDQEIDLVKTLVIQTLFGSYNQ